MAWYENTTRTDLIIPDLGIKIPAGHVVNPQQLKSTLTLEQLYESDAIGSLQSAQKQGKLVKVPPPPEKKRGDTTATERIKESSVPIPSRTRSTVRVDPKRKQYIEDLLGDLNQEKLDKLADYADGFAEPELEAEVLVGDNEIAEETAVKNITKDRYRPVRVTTAPDSNKNTI